MSSLEQAWEASHPRTGLKLKSQTCRGTIKGRVLNIGGSGELAWASLRKSIESHAPRGAMGYLSDPTIMTSAEGLFDFCDLCGGEYEVRATSGTGELGGSVVGVRPSAAVTLHLMPNVEIVGQVRSRGAVVKDFHVTLAGSIVFQTGFYDTAGRFGIPRVPLGTYELFIRADEGYWTDSLFVGAPGPVETNVDLKQWASVRGRITDSAGKPIPDVIVDLVSEPSRMSSDVDYLGPGVRIQHMLSNQNGEVSFEMVPAGRGYVAVFRNGRTLYILDAQYSSQYGPLFGPNHSLSFSVDAGQHLDLGKLRVGEG